MYDTPRAALEALTDDTLFEEVAVKVLRTRFPGLRITGRTGDLGRDGFERPLFAQLDDVVLLVSCEKAWTAKLRRDLAPYGNLPAAERPTTAIFVTNQSTKQTDQLRLKEEASDQFGITLEIADLTELGLELQSDALHGFAESRLSVRPREPRVLQPPVVYWEAQRSAVPGADAPLVGRDREDQQLRAALAPERALGQRLVVVEGPGGIGKTRLAVEVAHELATTLVAPTGVSLSGSHLTDVPVDTASIVVVDDAHRSPDLSGLTAMLIDPRFGRVRVVLIMRPGYRDTVLTQLGQERSTPTVVTLQRLSDKDIDTIVVDHGLVNTVFRQHVITLAEGNPLLAHTACRVAREQHVYTWNDTASLLGDLLTDRFRHIRSDPDEHRAAAIALALLTTASNGEDLAALGGAITALPPEPHRLDILLENLADVGIAVGRPYTLRPDMVGPVLVATALDQQARVRIDLNRVLPALGRKASPHPQPAAELADHYLLGVGPVTPQPEYTYGMNVPRLAAQLSVLAQAASQAGHHGVLATLSRALHQLLPDDPDMLAWQYALTLAAPIAPFRPALLDELGQALASQWPLTPTPWVVDVDGERRRRSGVQILLTHAGQLSQAVGHTDPGRAVMWMMDCSWLSFPILGTAAVTSAADAIAPMTKGRLRSTNETWDHVFERRQRVLDALLSWGRERFGGPPRTLSVNEHAARPPALVAHALLAALGPFWGVVTDDMSVKAPDDPDTMVWTQFALPDDPRRASMLADALNAIGELFGQLDLSDLTAREFLRSLARLPMTLRERGAAVWATAHRYLITRWTHSRQRLAMSTPCWPLGGASCR